VMEAKHLRRGTCTSDSSVHSSPVIVTAFSSLVLVVVSETAQVRVYHVGLDVTLSCQFIRASVPQIELLCS
jgi:hypothetical protein